MLESLARSENQTTVDLPVNEIAAELRATIERFESQLVLDKSGAAWQRPDGLLMELRCLSKNTMRLGGPSFCE